MSDFEQLPGHQTTYKRFIWKFSQAKENFENDEGFINLYNSIGYDFIGEGLVESHDIIKDFDGQCPDDADNAEMCTWCSSASVGLWLKIYEYCL